MSSINSAAPSDDATLTTFPLVSEQLRVASRLKVSGFRGLILQSLLVAETVLPAPVRGTTPLEKALYPIWRDTHLLETMADSLLTRRS